MSYIPSGKHLIAGEWVSGSKTFASEPAHGAAHEFSVGSVDNVNAAVAAAELAFTRYSKTSRQQRADFLNCIADEIESRAKSITEIGFQETGLPTARLHGERGRTTGQLRLFAEHILKGDYLDRRHDQALPDREPLPRPDLRMMQQAIGPIAVFGASNFPLAFSTAGGDTASALAAGCPVVVKGHGAHPGTGEIIAEAIAAAIEKCQLDPGVFSLIQGGDREVGQTLVQHPKIKAVGFTGSLGGGRALFDLCCARPEPIPFFGELGSINPMYVLPNALNKRAAELGAGWAASLTMGAGQFCTKPGIALVIDDNATVDAFINAATEALEQQNAQTMLTDQIAESYRSGRERVEQTTGVRTATMSLCDLREATPSLFEVSGADWLANKHLDEEIFGPFGLVIRIKDEAQLLKIAEQFDGQITCTLQLEETDKTLAQQLMPILERTAGRVLANGFPTGVEVCDSMVHGGPYPASTNFGATSVGTLAIRRWLRPVCYQNLPDFLLPTDLVTA